MVGAQIVKARDFKTFAGSEEANRIQDAVTDALLPFTASPLNGHVLVYNISLSTAPTAIAHKLGNQFQGWLVASKDAAEDIFEISRNSKTVTLQATGTVTINLLVF